MKCNPILVLLSPETAENMDLRSQLFKERRITCKELNIRVDRLANELMAQDVNKGMKVTLIFNNSNEFVEPICAVLKIGGIVIPINTQLTSQETYNFLDYSDSSTLIFDRSFLEKVELIREKSQEIGRYIIVGDEKKSAFLHYESLLQKASSREPEGIKAEDSDDA